MSGSRTAQRREDKEVEFARIVAFSDGVFAIAITLLVLNLEVPNDLHGESLWPSLWGQRQDLFAYGISFAVIGRFWIIHHRFFGEVTGFDGRLLSFNLFYLGWVVLIPFSSQVLGAHGSEAAAIVLYAGNMAGVVLVGMLMFTDARRAGFSRVDTDQARDFNSRSLVIAGVFMASIPVAVVDPHIAQFVWLGLFAIPLYKRVRSD